MRQPHLALIAATAALALLAVPLSTAEAKRRPTCKPRHSKTLEVNKAIRVYRITRKVRGGDEVTATYACRNKTHRKVRMGALTFSEPYNTGKQAIQIQLRGRFVAYGLRDVSDARSKYMQAPTPGDKVIRIDITRKHPLKVLAQTPAEGTLTDVALTGRGAVAWIERNLVGNSFSPSSTPYTVRLADAAGTRSLASGTNVVPGSLAMSGSFAYWRRAATAFSAKLTY